MSTPSTDRPKGTGPFYLVALVCSGLSLDTAARYFHGHMGINGLPIHGISAELAAICGVGELTLVACGYAMRHSVRRDGKPGAAQLVALSMCSAATFMAIALDGPVAGALRAFFGPILALITLHLALGIEVKVHSGVKTGTWARIVAEFRERFLSRLGLGDDERKAAERTRDRARDKAARLATATGWVPRRTQRLAKAVRASGATLDPVQRDRLVEQVAVLRSVADLAEIKMASPWAAVAAERDRHPQGSGTPGTPVPADPQHPGTPAAQAPARPVPAPPTPGCSTPTGAPLNGASAGGAAPLSVGAGTPSCTPAPLPRAPRHPGPTAPVPAPRHPP
ncbi:hypothetical protein [Dactylosporangium sp. CA-139066]|uniref:hypothetical protein n=1 Tax=Dactylosporangium sp. CA-139066 TaxID=3239930 RepID=UPI003D912E3F